MATPNRWMSCAAGAGVLVLIAWLMVAGRIREALVVYCAHDLVFSQQLIDSFQKQTGVHVEVVGDTEPAKSLGLVQRLEREKDHPRCDVFWNNEPLGTMSLAAKGMFEAYSSSEERKRPPEFQDPDHHWVGFGVRYRVWIVNLDKLECTPEAIEARMNAPDLSRVAIAEPLYGTTLTQWSLMWNRLGAEECQKWHRSLKDRGAHFVKGNGMVKDLVAAGTCDFGMTDTDDFFAAIDAKAPVGLVPIRVQGKTIAIPNAVSIVRGTKHEANARRFMDAMLSRSADMALARSGSRQAPVHLELQGVMLPPDVALISGWSKEAASLEGLLQSRDECLAWLMKEFAP